MGLSRRRFPTSYDPATDGTLALWLDATDSSAASLLDTIGGAITNGATIGSWISKAGPARTFQLFGANGRPTWSSTGVNGLGAATFDGVNQILSTAATTDLVSMPAMTVLVVEQNVDGSGAPFAITESHDTGDANATLVNVSAGRAAPTVGGRRLQGNAFQDAGAGISVGANVRNIQGGVWNWASAAISYTQNGVLIARAVAFQTAGNTSAVAPFRMSVGGFAQETLLSNGNPYKGSVSEVFMWLSAKTPEELVLPTCFFRKKYATPW